MYLLLDFGGTNTRIAISKSGKKIDKVVMVATPKQFSKAMDVVAAFVSDLTNGQKIKATAAGIFGPLDKLKTKLVKSKLPDWKGKPLKQRLTAITKSKVVLENDAALAALGEAIFGAGTRKSIVGFYTVSTGVGGAKVVDGRIDKTSIGFEPEWQTINGKYLGQEISGKSFRARFHKLPTDVTNKKAWADFEINLSIALANTITLWSPDVFVLGGPMITNSPISLRRINLNVKKLLKPIFPTSPKIVKAKLGQLNGLYGALAMLRK